MAKKKRLAAGNTSKRTARKDKAANLSAKKVSMPHRELTSRKANAKSTTHRINRLKLIARVTGAVVGEEPLVKQAEEMADRVRTTLGIDGCVIRLLEDNELVLLASSGIPKDKLNLRVPMGWGISKEIFSRRCPISIPDVHNHPAIAGLVKSLQSYYEFTAYAGAPLLTRGRVIGILGVYLEREARQFRDADLDYLQILANNITVAIVNDRLYNEIKGQKEQLEVEVTERKRTEQTLRESEERFQSAFDYAAIGMVLVAPNGRFLKANRSMCEIVGYSEEELLTKTFQDITHQDDLEVDLIYVQKMLRGEIRTYQMEKRYFHKLGHVVWVVLSVSLVQDNRGQPLYFISQVQDITARKKTEASLQESDRQLREQFLELDQLYKFSPVGLYALDRDLRFLRINEQLAEIDGISVEEHLGRTIPEVVPNLAEQLQKLWQPIFEKGEPVLDVEVSGMTAKAPGVLRHWLNNYFPMTSSTGEVVGLMAAVVEITDRKRAEKDREQLQAQLRQAQKMEAVGRLSGGIAHDFNNLLTVVQGNAEIASMLLQANTTMRNADMLVAALEEIKLAVERAANLTAQLLTFSRKHVIDVHVLDMHAVVHGMENMLRRLIREDISFEIAGDPDEYLIEADKTQIEQVLVNLVVNASDAMPDGGKLSMQVSDVTLDEAYVRRQVDARTGPHVLITVTDTGIGMDINTLDHLFEPFFTNKPFGKGTGLGLSIVYGIVKQSGGHITVESQPGKGSTFNLYFPAVRGEVSRSVKPPVPEWERGHGTILLCEDEVSLRSLAASVLTKSGYTVIEAENGEQAVQLAADYEGVFQLLITDVVMPGMKGDKLAAAILRDQPDVQVLFMSGYAADVLSVESITERGLEFLQKPFKPEMLLRRVREILNKTRK